MGWFKKLFVSNIPENETAREAEMSDWAEDVNTALTREPEEEVVFAEIIEEEPKPTGVEHDFLHGTFDHVIYTDHGHVEEITGHGYGSKNMNVGDVVRIKGVTGNILRYRLTRLDWAPEPPNMFFYDAVKVA